jgi:hypothetical protein
MMLAYVPFHTLLSVQQKRTYFGLSASSNGMYLVLGSDSADSVNSERNPIVNSNYNKNSFSHKESQYFQLSCQSVLAIDSTMPTTYPLSSRGCYHPSFQGQDPIFTMRVPRDYD